MLNFVQVFESNKTTRHTHTEKKGACHRLFIFESRGVPVYPLPLFPLSLCAAVVVLVSCRFQAAEQQLQSAQTFPYISIHFYCHAHEHTAPQRCPPLCTTLLNSKKQQPSGRWKFFFPFPLLLGKHKEKKKEKLFLHNEFLRIFHLYEPVQPCPPATIAPAHPAGNRFVVLVACLPVKNFHFPFYFSLSCSCSKSHRARLTMQIAGKYLGLWLGKLRVEEEWAEY